MNVIEKFESQINTWLNSGVSANDIRIINEIDLDAGYGGSYDIRGSNVVDEVVNGITDLLGFNAKYLILKNNKSGESYAYVVNEGYIDLAGDEDVNDVITNDDEDETYDQFTDMQTMCTFAKENGINNIEVHYITQLED